MNTPIENPIIQALVRRHAGDAAFYWMQLDSAAQSPNLIPADLARFDGLLAAHLEGLDVADEAGFELALAGLERWQKPGEAFVATWLAARGDRPDRLDAVLAMLRRRPDALLRGAISALAWTPDATAHGVIARWTQATDEPVAQVAALRAAALLGGHALAVVSPEAALRSDSPFVRAAACRACIGAAQSATLLPALIAALEDADHAMRAEAAIALGAIGSRGGEAADRVLAAIETLWQCVGDEADQLKQKTGWNRMQAQRRLNRWLRCLAYLLPCGTTDANLAVLFDNLPPRLALSFALHHGDPAHLPFVIAQMENPKVERYAAWVWQSVTGVDFVDAGLALAGPPEPQAGPALTDAGLDAELGLPRPDLPALRERQTSYDAALQAGRRYLLGAKLTREHALAVLEHGALALRPIAAHALWIETGIRVLTRGPLASQIAAIRHARGAAA